MQNKDRGGKSEREFDSKKMQWKNESISNEKCKKTIDNLLKMEQISIKM